MIVDDVGDQRAWLIAVSKPRQLLYAFLGNSFSRPPSAEDLVVLQDDSFLRFCTDLLSDAAVAPLQACAAQARDTADIEEEARREFMNLFKVPGGQYIAPYESVFRDTRDIGGRKVQGLLMGQSAIDVQKWYQLAAIEISKEYKDLPDHIALELNYLAHLCGKEQQFVAAGDDSKLTRSWEMERDFLKTHIVSWIDAFRDKVHEKSRHIYYRTVADLTVTFTGRDLATLEGVVGASSGKSVPAYDGMPS